MNKKGFTLIELLAVIVILAVLILVALPAVTNLMQRARKSAFRSETLSMAREGIQLAYSANMVSGVATNVTAAVAQASASNKVFKISGGEYMCMTFKNLIEKGYIDKNDANNNYGGYVQIFVPSTIDSSNKVQMYIKMTNGTYYIADTFDNVAASNDVDTLVKTGTNSLTKDTLCPAIATNSTWNGTAKLMGA